MTIDATFVIPGDHPSLQGHFPGNPVVPGALALDRAVAALMAQGIARPGRIVRAKFLSPMPTDTPCRLRAARRADGTLTLECTAGDVHILSAVLEVADT